jgi:class 3 adenylate cyclase
MPATIQFDSTASQPKHGLAMIYDLEGFSVFFNQPDVQDYVPKFLNRVSEAISVLLYGGIPYWEPEPHQLSPLSSLPIHEKYMGDGAMYVWLQAESEPFSQNLIGKLCNRLWNLKKFFPEVIRAAHEDLPVVDLPARIRFGIVRGNIYELRRQGSEQREYIGFCINLASRLQKYCPDLGFIASARLGLPTKSLEKHGYIRVVAKHIKGFPREIVIIDKDEWDALSPSIREQLFEMV